MVLFSAALTQVTQRSPHLPILSQPEGSHSLVGALTRGCRNVKCAVTLENSLAAPYTVKYTLPIRSSLSTPRCLPERNENICPHICSWQFYS